MKYLILNLPDTTKYIIHRNWAGTFGTAELKIHHDGGRFLPIELLYSASALINSDKEFRLIDAQAQELDNTATVSAVKDFKPDVIVSMICLPSYKNDLEILDSIKIAIPDTKIVLLGGLANVISEKILNESKIDYLINGRYPFYNNLIEFIKKQDKAKGITYKKNGKIIKNPKLEDANDLNEINFKAYDLIDLEKCLSIGRDKFGNIIKWIPLLTGVGCPYPCSYCAYPLAYGKKFIYKDIDLVIDEIVYIIDKFGITDFCMRDIVFTQNRARVIELCNKIQKRNLKIKFLFETRVDCVDEELLQILKKAGCYQINFGFETGSSQIFENIGKPGADIESLKKAFSLTKKYSIITIAHIILGLPSENKDTIEETYKLLKEIKPDGVNFNYITPYPGTKMHDYARTNNLIVENNWSNYTSHNVVMKSEYLSVDDLRKIGNKLDKKLAIYNLFTNKRFRKLWIKKYLRFILFNKILRRPYNNLINDIKLDE